MDNKEANTLTVQNLLNDINTLEAQNKNAKSKLQKLTNDLKTEERKKNEYEVKLHEYKERNEFYLTQATKMSKRLKASRKVFSQFELATECYKRHINVYKETLKPDDTLEIDQGKDLDTKDASQELQIRREHVQRNSETINSLMNSLLAG